MFKWKQIFGLMAFASLLLFGFQNCGMQYEEDLASASDDFDTSGLSFNPDGTFTFPLPGENMENGGSSGSGGDINLGSDGGVSGSGGGSGGSGGYFGDDPYNPYQIKNSKFSIYPAVPTNGGLFGNKLYYFTNNNAVDRTHLWESFTYGISRWEQEEQNTEEREKLIVVSFQKVAQDATTATYEMKGTSICHWFSAKIQVPKSAQTYSVSLGIHNQSGVENFTQFSGYRMTVSEASMTPKVAEEKTLLESSGCMGVASMDQKAVSNFLNLFKQYPYLYSKNSRFQLLNGTGLWYGALRSVGELAPF